jgi:hypothetical protein
VLETINKFELSNVRFCLVEGTFDSAIVLSENKPWANFIPLEIGDLEAQRQLKSWQDGLARLYPKNGIENGDPLIFLDDSSTRKGAVTEKVLFRSVLGIAETARAYVVFGDIGFPLTFVANTNIKRDPIPLFETIRLVRPSELETGLAKANTAVNLQLIKKMVKYGMLFVEQAAGGWLQLVMDATGVTDSQAGLIIQGFARLLVQIDQGA